MIKYAAKKQKNFQLAGSMLYPRGVNENKVNAFNSYYPCWKRSHQLCQEAERREKIKTASDTRAGVQHQVLLPSKCVWFAI